MLYNIGLYDQNLELYLVKVGQKLTKFIART